MNKFTFDEACAGLGLNNPFLSDGLETFNDGFETFNADGKENRMSGNCRPKCFEKRRLFEEIEKICVFRREVPCHRPCHKPCSKPCNCNCRCGCNCHRPCENHCHPNCKPNHCEERKPCHIIHRGNCFCEILKCLFCVGK